MSQWCDDILDNLEKYAKKIESITESLKKIFLNIIPIFGLLSSIFLLLIAYITPNNREILPWYGWIVLIAVVLILLFYYLFITKKRVEVIKSANSSPIYMIRHKMRCFHTVCWKTCFDPTRFYGSTDGIMVLTPPRCPHCKIDLEEWKPNFGKFLWKCPECKFQIKSKISMSEAAIKLKNIIIGEIRTKNQ